MVRRPDMFLFEETEDDPMIVIGLPLSVVRTLIDISYRHITPSMGLDQSFMDELLNQLAEQKEELGIED